MKKIFKLPLVQEHTGLSRSSIYAAVARGEFPKPLQLGVRSVGWLEDDVAQWIEQKIEDSQKAPK